MVLSEPPERKRRPSRCSGQLAALVDDVFVVGLVVVEQVELGADLGDRVGRGRFLGGDERVGHRMNRLRSPRWASGDTRSWT